MIWLNSLGHIRLFGHRRLPRARATRSTAAGFPAAYPPRATLDAAADTALRLRPDTVVAAFEPMRTASDGALRLPPELVASDLSMGSFDLAGNVRLLTDLMRPNMRLRHGRANIPGMRLPPLGMINGAIRPADVMRVRIDGVWSDIRGTIDCLATGEQSGQEQRQRRHQNCHLSHHILLR